MTVYQLVQEHAGGAAWVDATVFYPESSNTISADHVVLDVPVLDDDSTMVPVDLWVLCGGAQPRQVVS